MVLRNRRSFSIAYFLNTYHIFTFSLTTFDISVLFSCYLYEKCIVSLPGLQHILFFSFKSNCNDLKLGFILPD